MAQLFLLITAFLTLGCEISYGQTAVTKVTAVTKGAPRRLALKDAIEIAMTRNLEYAVAGKNYELSKINYDTAWRTYFLPNITINAYSSSDFTLGAIPKTPAVDTLGQSRNHGYPNSALTLSLGSYNIFNFWRDRLSYDSAKLSYERQELVLVEARRNLKFQVINSYFQAKLNQEILDAAQRSLVIAQTILNLVKSRVPLGKATLNEVDSATVDMSDAKFQVEAVGNQYLSGLFGLNALLNFPLDTVLNLSTPIDYRPFTLTLPQLITNFKQAAPTIRSSKVGVQVAENNLELAEKNRMPLPTVSFSGVSVTYANRYAGGYNTYSSANGTIPGGQLDLQAVVNLTIPILGPNGFLGSDAVRFSRTQYELADVQFQNSLVTGETQIRTLYEQIKQLQDQLVTIKTSFDSSSTLLDRMVSELSKHPANRLELRDALASARSSELSYLQTSLSFIYTKNALLAFAGLDPEVGQ